VEAVTLAFGDDEIANLRSGDPSTRIAALGRLAPGTITHKEVEALTGCLSAPEKLVQRRAAETCARLQRAGIDMQPILFSVLRCTDLRRRWGAVFALSLIGPVPREAVETLMDSLGLDDGDIRWAAADLLLGSGYLSGCTEKLTDLLVDGNPHQRKMAAYCLRALELRSQRIDRALLNALADSSASVRLAALSALSRMAVDRAAAERGVARALGDADAGVR